MKSELQKSIINFHKSCLEEKKDVFAGLVDKYTKIRCQWRNLTSHCVKFTEQMTEQQKLDAMTVMRSDLGSLVQVLAKDVITIDECKQLLGDDKDLTALVAIIRFLSILPSQQNDRVENFTMSFLKQFNDQAQQIIIHQERQNLLDALDTLCAQQQAPTLGCK